MKRILLIVCCTLALYACQEKKGFTINGTLQGDVEGAVVLLQNYTDDNVETLDSAIVVNGTFLLQGVVETPARYQLLINATPPGAEMPDFEKMFSTSFYLENSSMKCEANIDDLPVYSHPERTGKIVITGSKTNDLYEQLQAKLQPLRDQIKGLKEQIETKDPTDYVAEETALNSQLTAQISQFIQSNPQSIIAVDLLNERFSRMPVPYTATELDEMFAWVSDAWNGTPQVEALKRQLERAKKTSIGAPFIDAEFVTPEGESVKLSSLISSEGYTMLEFWASWCTPCRKEIPHLIEVHEKYKDLNIISVSVDEQEDQWKNALESENMTWTQLRNTSGIGGVVFNEYGINSIPACIIFDKDGNFYKTNMRGVYLDAFLKEVYGE